MEETVQDYKHSHFKTKTREKNKKLYHHAVQFIAVCIGLWDEHLTLVISWALLG